MPYGGILKGTICCTIWRRILAVSASECGVLQAYFSGMNFQTIEQLGNYTSFPFSMGVILPEFLRCVPPVGTEAGCAICGKQGKARLG